jgi:hypothetical protein
MGGMTGTGMGGTGGAPHLTGNGGSTGMGGTGGAPHLTGDAGSTGMGGGSAGSGMGGTGTMVDPRCAPLDGIVSWWHGDGDFDDAVGSNDGTNGGSVAFVAGIDNQAFSFNGGAGSAVEVPDDPSLMMTTAVTIDAWINQTALGGRIVDKATVNWFDGYLLDIAGDRLRMFIGTDSIMSNDPVPAGVFTHVVGLYDGHNVAVYINGALSAEHPTDLTSLNPNTLPLHIGSDSGGGSMFPGIIDEPRVFNRALTADEVALLFWQGTHCQ